jgi:hypothetical protein
VSGTRIRPAKRLACALLVSLACESGATKAAAEVHEPKIIVVPIFERLFVDAGVLAAWPRGDLTGPFGDVHPGVSLHFGVGLRKIPIAFGIGFHETSLTGGSSASSDTGIYDINGQIGIGRLYLSQSATVRHFDAFVRLEPDWRRVRPYLELLGGTSQIFVVSTLSATFGGQLDSTETNGDLTWEWGYGGGIRCEPLRPWLYPTGSISLVVSAGVRWVNAGPLRYLGTRSEMLGGQAQTVVNLYEANYRTVEPYLTIGIASRGP